MMYEKLIYNIFIHIYIFAMEMKVVLILSEMGALYVFKKMKPIKR